MNTACSIGRILNRFSTDTGHMDILLPILFVDIFSVGIFKNIGLFCFI